MNKTIKLIITASFLATVGLGTVTSVSAAEETEGKVEYTAGELQFNPDPIDGVIDGSLSEDLDFGSHAIQTAKEETFIAYQDGDSTKDETKGTLGIIDDRGTNAGWNVKVKQQNQFNTAANATGDYLTGAQLSIKTNTLTNSLGNAGDIVGPGTSVALTIGAGNVGQEVQILNAPNGNSAGVTVLPLDQFELTIPAGVDKVQSEYQAVIDWTISDTPV